MPDPAVRIALIGEHDPSIIAHRAIPLALARAGERLETRVAGEWLATDLIRGRADLTAFAGIWCVPGSPYRSLDGALLAIRHARESSVPFLGTCGGFQHALLEYARAVLGWADAEHGETAPQAARMVIAPLECSLVEVAEDVRFVPGTRMASAYGRATAREGYHCRYGVNPEFQSRLLGGELRPAAYDEAEQLRGVDLAGHPFFVAALFQPERAALQGRDAPLVNAFVAASRNRAGSSSLTGAGGNAACG